MGAAGGAAIGYGTGYGVGKGALIGTGVGAAAGAIYDIYNMNLKADLVVLSACQTALGKDIKGEGLVGLTRAFMYAGATRVVASLWKTDDRGTAALDKGVIAPSTTYEDRGCATIGGRTLCNAGFRSYGQTTVTQILARSQNAGAVFVASKLGAADLNAYVHAFGFGERTGVDLAAETGGIVRPLAEWYPVEKRGLALGIQHAAYPWGTGLGAIATGAILAAFGPENWRYVFLIIPLAMIPIWIGYWLFSTRARYEKETKGK